MIPLTRQFLSAILLVTVCVGAQAQTSKGATFTEERLFSKETVQPISVWTGAAEDGSRRTVELSTADGVALRGWAMEGADLTTAFILTFHGNNETIADAGTEAMDTFFSSRLYLNTITFDYRGTGFSAGAISLKSALSDSLEIYDEVVKRAAGQPVFVCGWSLGSIFASYVAGHRASVAGLILVAPIATADTWAAALGRTKKTVLTVPASLESIQNLDELKRYHNPLLIVHGTADTVVAITEGQQDFRAAASKDKRFVVVQGKGHVGTIWSIEAESAIAEFMKQHGATGRPPN